MSAGVEHGAAAPVIGLRPVDASADAELLIAIYASTRAEELAPVPWTDAEKDAFIRMQFAAQDSYWREQRPATAFSVIVVDGTDAGRIYIDRTGREIRIVDFALLPDQRNRGVGTRLVRELLDEGVAAGLPVTIHVECKNPARSLYDRLGFEQIGTTGVYDLLTRRPDPYDTEASDLAPDPQP